MSLISVVLTLFAVVLMLAGTERPRTLVVGLGGLALGLYLLPGPAKVAAPLAVILAFGLNESIASLKPR